MPLYVPQLFQINSRLGHVQHVRGATRLDARPSAALQSGTRRDVSPCIGGRNSKSVDDEQSTNEGQRARDALSNQMRMRAMPQFNGRKIINYHLCHREVVFAPAFFPLARDKRIFHLQRPRFHGRRHRAKPKALAFRPSGKNDCKRSTAFTRTATHASSGPVRVAMIMKVLIIRTTVCLQKSSERIGGR